MERSCLKKRHKFAFDGIKDGQTPATEPQIYPTGGPRHLISRRSEPIHTCLFRSFVPAQRTGPMQRPTPRSGMSFSATYRGTWILLAFAGARASSLHELVERGDMDAVEMALASGADPNAFDSDHYTPLQLAAGFGNVELVERLLASGADTDSRDENGETALHLAAHVGHAAVCTILLDAGAPIEAASETGYTPLHMAAERGHAAIVRSLLSRGANVAATTTLGATPLHWAAYHDHPEAVAILLRHGASPAARDAEGETAATLANARAQSGSHSDVLELLKGLARHDRERRQELRHRQEQEQQHDQQEL